MLSRSRPYHQDLAQTIALFLFTSGLKFIAEAARYLDKGWYHFRQREAGIFVLGVLAPLLLCGVLLGNKSRQTEGNYKAYVSNAYAKHFIVIRQWVFFKELWRDLKKNSV